MDSIADVLRAAAGSPAQQNAPYIAPGARPPYATDLGLLDEFAFRKWVAGNKVPFNPESTQPQDYDMRGFWRALQGGDPRATSSVNPNDNQVHYPDYWKTPNHRTFSSESQWAGEVAPRWNEQDQLVAPSGRILFDERR